MQAQAARAAARELDNADDERERLGVMHDLTDGVLRLRTMQDVMRLAEPHGVLQVGTVRKLFDAALDPLERAVVELAGVLDVSKMDVCRLVNRARPGIAGLQAV